MSSFLDKFIGMSTDTQWHIIVNPTAANGKVKKQWPGLEAELREALIDIHIEFTEHEGHGILLAQKAIEEGFRRIIAIGGDGTNNEVINGILNQQTVPSNAISYCLFPVGTGNDWIKTHGIPKKIKPWLEMLKKGKTKYQDIGLVNCIHNGQEVQRYFANVAGMAYDAFLVQFANRNKGLVSNKIFYLFLILRCLFAYRLKKAKIVFDNQTDENHYYIINLGICSYSGGGMQTVPHAVEDDGLLALTIAGPLSKLGVILNTYRFYNGTVGQHRLVNCHQVKQVSVEAKEEAPTLVEVDGEFIGQTPAHFSIIEKGLKVITP